MGYMADTNRRSGASLPGRVFAYVKNNPHMAVSVGLFGAGAGALATNITPLAGSLFGAGGALLGGWITELNKRRTDAHDKAMREHVAADALAPELQRTIERVLYIHDRALANFTCESAMNGLKPNDLQIDFKPYLPTLYPSAPQVRDLPGESAIALIRYYDSLNELEKLVEEWWERKGQLAINIFNGILHSAEKCLRLGLVCIREFELEDRFPPQYESWGTISSRIEGSLSSNANARKHHHDRTEARQATPAKGKEATSFRQY